MGWEGVRWVTGVRFCRDRSLSGRDSVDSLLLDILIGKNLSGRGLVGLLLLDVVETGMYLGV
jgi:hypothetical protein